MISIGLGYLDSYVVSTNFAVVIALLSSYLKTSNHPVTGFIIVTAFRCKFSFLSLLSMNWGPVRSTQSLFRGISSANLAGNLLLFYLIVLYVGKCHNYLLTSGQNILCRASTNVGKSSPPFYLFLDEGYTYGTNAIRNFVVLTE